MQNKLGIIAGSGPLPLRLVKACQESSKPYFVVAIAGEAELKDFNNKECILIEIGKLNQTINALKKAKCSEVVMAGPVKRPSLNALKLDLRAIKLLTKFATVKNHGDDALLRILVNELETEGFKVVGADEILGQGVIAKPGVMGKHAPNKYALDDISLGLNVAKTLGLLDIGQSVVIQQKLVIGVEAVEGTDSLLHRCSKLMKEGEPGVLVKVKKPGQEHRTDLPTIGINTVRMSIKANLSGIAVLSENTLIIDYDAVINEANAYGLFIYGQTDN